MFLAHIYNSLRLRNRVKSKIDFSVRYCKRSKGYLSYLLSSGANASVEVLLNCAAACRALHDRDLVKMLVDEADRLQNNPRARAAAEAAEAAEKLARSEKPVQPGKTPAAPAQTVEPAVVQPPVAQPVAPPVASAAPSPRPATRSFTPTSPLAAPTRPALPVRPVLSVKAPSINRDFAFNLFSTGRKYLMAIEDTLTVMPAGEQRRAAEHALERLRDVHFRLFEQAETAASA